MLKLERLPVGITAVMLGLVVVATANLTGLGIGSLPLLYDTTALPRLVVALVLVPVAWTLWILAPNSPGARLRFDPVWALLILLFVWSIISAVFSDHSLLGVLGQSERLEGVVTVGLYAAVYGLALQLARSSLDVRLLYSALGLAAVIVSIYGLVQYAGLEPFDYSVEGYAFEARRAFSTFGNPTFLAGLLVLALPIVGVLALTAHQPWARVAWGVGTLVVATTLFATFSRGAWLGALVQLPLMFVLLRRTRAQIQWAEVLRFAIVVIVLIVALTIASLNAADEINIVERLTGAIEQTGSARERRLVADAAIDAAMARPLTGYGPDAFLPAFRMHRPADYMVGISASSTINNAHSWPLQYAATLGFPGAILLTLAVGLALWRSRRDAIGARSLRPPPTEMDSELSSTGSILLSASWVGCLGYAVHMLTGVAVVGSTLPFWLLLGVIGVPEAREVRIPASVRRVSTALGVAVAAVAVAGSIVMVSADAHYIEARVAYRHGDSEGALELVRQARALNPLSVKYARGVAQISASVVYEAIAEAKAPATVRSMYDETLDDFSRVRRQHPHDYPNMAWLAALQASAGLYLENAELLAQSRSTAREAARLDIPAEQVLGLSTGDVSDESILRARSVSPLP